MNKSEFIGRLSDGLKGFPAEEIEKSVSYYSEMIDDRTEDGMSEEEAVAALGDISEVIRNSMLDIPMGTLVKNKITKRRSFNALEITLLAVGAPLWLSLLIAFASVIFSVYVSIWSVIVSLCAALVGILVGGLSGLLASPLFFVLNVPSGFFILGSGLVCLGISIPAFFGVKYLCALLIKLTKLFIRAVKRLFVSKPQNNI